jgi:hypothetical protein
MLCTDQLVPFQVSTKGDLLAVPTVVHEVDDGQETRAGLGFPFAFAFRAFAGDQSGESRSCLLPGR